MALGDLLSLLQMPQAVAAPSVMSGYTPSTVAAPANLTQPQAFSPTPTNPDPTNTLNPSMPMGTNTDPNYLLGHHVNNLLQVTGNLTPPPGVSVPTDATQANIPGGAQPNPAQQPDYSANQTDPHYNRDHVNGPFKLHGVAGDVLGHMMDMVLVGAGLPAEYGPRVAAAKQADAIANAQGNVPQAYQNLVANSGVTTGDAYENTQSEIAKRASDAADAAAKLTEAKTVAQAAIQKRVDDLHAKQANYFTQFIGADPNNPAVQRNFAAVKAAAQKERDAFGDTDPLPADLESAVSYANSTKTAHEATQEGIEKARADQEQRYQSGELGLRGQEVRISASHAASVQAVDRATVDHLTAETGKISNPQGKITDPNVEYARQLHAYVTARNNGLPTGPAPTPPALRGANPGPASGASALAPNAAQITLLKSNPSLAAHFDQKFGKGAAAKYIGK